METETLSQSEQTVPQDFSQTSPLAEILSDSQIKSPSSKNPVKMIAAISGLAVVVIGGLMLNWNYLKVIFIIPKKQVTPPIKSQPSITVATKTASQIDVGEKTIVVKPGQNDYTLADGETKILFSNSGSSTSVPDVVFGDRYNLNDIHNINYLPIRREIAFYNKGFFILLKNLGCKTETRFTDVLEVWVTECIILTTSRQEVTPLKSISPFSKEINTRTSFSGSVTASPNDLLIYITMPRLSIQNFSTKLLSENVSLESGSMTSYSADTPWDIRVISGYGIDTIRYTAQEVWNKVSKEVVIGSLKVNTTIKNLDCKVIYIGNNNEQTQRCDDILVDFSFSQEGGNQIPIKLTSYQE